MLYQSAVAATLFGAALARPTFNPTPYVPPNNSTIPSSNNIPLIEKLQLAPTAADRIKMLTPADFKFDFLSPPTDATTTGKGGHTVKADRLGFPALIGTGVGMTVGFIGPCGFNTPHTHPRSSEINIVIQGELGTQFFAENGVDYISNTLGEYQMTVFPQGALHTEFNTGCGDAVFVAGFASEDPGVEQGAQALFGLDREILQATLGGKAVDGTEIEKFKGLIPANVAVGVESCLAKCNLQKK